MNDWIPRPYRMKEDRPFSGPKKGDIVYRWTGPTYGLLEHNEVAVSAQPDENPFYTVDRNELEMAAPEFFVQHSDDPLISTLVIKWVPYD